MARADSRRLTISLPAEVWDRLNSEAAGAGVPIGRYAQRLFVARDERRRSSSAAGARPSTTSNAASNKKGK